MNIIKTLEEKSASLANFLRPYLPFTALNTVARHLDKNAGSILDVGCGKGIPMKFLNRHKGYYTVGVDIFEPYISECKSRGIYQDYIIGNVIDLENLVKPKSFDVVLCLEVLEHLDKADGLKLLKVVENIAVRQVILSTPVGRYVQHAYDHNPYQEHKSVWLPEDLRAQGYMVRGHGLRGWSGEDGVVSRIPQILAPLSNIIWVGAGPLVHFNPCLGGNMVGIKNIF